MWIEKIVNSKGTRYKYTERYTHPTTKRIIKVSVTLNSKSRHAQKEAALILQEKFKEKTITAAERIAAKVETITLAKVLHDWLQATAPTKKASTTIINALRIKKILSSLPEGLLLMEFSPAMAETTVTGLYYEQNLSYSYCNAMLGIMKSTMRYAKKAQYVQDVQAYQDIKLIKKPVTKEELQKAANKFLNRDELRACLEQLRQKDMRIAMAAEFMALTGLRVGELLALRVQDYDESRSIIHVNGTICPFIPNSDANKRSTPKNTYSYRDVYLNSRATHILAWFFSDNRRLLFWSKGMYQDKGYIFTAKHGFPYNQATINTTLKTAHIEGKHITSHIFRHTHISLLTEKGLSLKSIMQRVGHHNPNTTLAIYTHVTNTMNTADNHKIELLAVNM